MSEEIEHNITESILIKSLANHENVQDHSKIKINKFKVTAGSKRGDNFACEMGSIDVNAEIDGQSPKDYNFIVKMIPPNPTRAGMLKKMKIFTREVQIYEKVFPKLRDLGINIKVPKDVYFSDDEGVMVMENLRTEGFQLFENKLNGLGLDHMKLILSNHALLHAGGYHLIKTREASLREEFPILFENNMYNEDGSMKEEVAMWTNVITSNFKSNANVIRVIGKRDDLADKIDKVVETREIINDFAKYYTKLDEIPFKTIIHGDCWVNNFLFKYNDKKELKDIKLLDWQMSAINHPCMDLSYLIGTSTTPKFREKHLDEILQFYYGELKENLNKFGYDLEEILTFETLKKTYNDYHVFQFMIANFMVPMFCSDYSDKDAEVFFDTNDFEDENDQDFSKMADKMEDRGLKIAMKNPVLTERLIELTEEAIRYGYFD